MTAMPAGGFSTGTGEISRRTRLGEQQHRAAGDEGRLAEHRQRLGLAVAEAMLAVGRAHRMAHRDQVDQRRGGIEQRVDKARQQRDRAGFEPGGEFDRDQQRRDRDRGVGRQPPQPVGTPARGSREEPFPSPSLAFANEHQPIMQPKRPLLPELDALRHDPKAGPVRRPRHLALGKPARKFARPAVRARRGWRAAATGRRPRRRSGCRAAGWRNRRRPPRLRPARRRPRSGPAGSATST